MACIQDGWKLLYWAIEEKYVFGIQSLLGKKANTDVSEKVRGKGREVVCEVQLVVWGGQGTRCVCVDGSLGVAMLRIGAGRGCRISVHDGGGEGQNEAGVKIEGREWVRKTSE